MLILLLIKLLFIVPTFGDKHLKLIHVIFSHKFYAPVSSLNNYKLKQEQLDFKYFLKESDDMSNNEKMNMFNIGVYLRNKYNNFLGIYYQPNIMKMKTSEFTLSMISGELVNAGLWPPKDIQKWHESFDWQPIPSTYDPADNDTILLGTLCSSFLREEDKTYSKYKSKYQSKYKSLFSILSEGCGFRINKPMQVTLLQSWMETLHERNISLPTWAQNVFPSDEMRTVSLLSYSELSQTYLQKQLNSGTMLKTIIDDTSNHRNSNGTSKLKIILYSGEVRNVVGLLQNLDLSVPDILSAPSAIIFEVYNQTSSNEYLVKIIYYDVKKNLTIPFQLINCDEYCPMDKLTKLLKPILPVNETELCSTNFSTKFSISFSLFIVTLITCYIN